MKTHLIVAVLIMAVSFTAYLWYINKLFDKLDSISDSYYELENRKKGSGWLFTIFCWLLAFPLAFFSEVNGFFFLGAVGLGFLGAAPQFRKKMTETIHVIGAVTGIAGTFLAVIVLHWAFSLALIGYLVMVVITKYEIREIWTTNRSGKYLKGVAIVDAGLSNYTYKIELYAFITLLACLILVINYL